MRLFIVSLLVLIVPLGLQVKVWVGENLAHYYVLSRFLISRMLTVTKIPQMKVTGLSRFEWILSKEMRTS